MFPAASGANTTPGSLFADKYRIERQLPWGGLTAYYRATVEDGDERGGDKSVVLAVLPVHLDERPKLRAMFTRTARARALVRSRVLPRVLHASVAEGIPFFVLEDTRGALLQDLLNAKPLQSASALRIADDVLEALEAARRQGLVHADITPNNILIVRERDERIGARLLGLGLAPLLRGPHPTDDGAPRMGSGQHSVAYTAPELVGEHEFDHPADLYAVGALLHHMIQGVPPVRREIADGFEDVPALPEIIERAMAARPADRYPTAKAMQAALEWIEVESAKLNPETQDIAPWMEYSLFGSIPIASIASSVPPMLGQSSHPPGTVLTSSSGARTLPEPPPDAPDTADPFDPLDEDAETIARDPFAPSTPAPPRESLAPPIVIDQTESIVTKRLQQIVLLLLGVVLLVLLGLWLDV